MSDGKARFTVTITRGAERRVWCEKHLVSEVEVEVLMLASTGFVRVATHRDCTP